MIIVLGLIIVVAAVVAGVAGVLGNGDTHGLAHGFSVLIIEIAAGVGFHP